MATYTIGRSDDNTIVLNDTTVSRHHAELETRKRGVYVLRDLDSTYGTRIFRDGDWLNIIEVEVTDATEVTFGEYRTTIGEVAALAAAPEAAADVVAAEPQAGTPAEPAAPDEPPAPAVAPVAAPATPPAPAPSSSGAGPDKRTTMFILIGGGVLVLIVIAAIIFAIVRNSSAVPGNRAALAPPSSATRATFEASLVTKCSRHGRLNTEQCRCIARQISAALTREELAIYLAWQRINGNAATAREIVERFGKDKIAAIQSKHRDVLGRVQKECGLTLKR